jgi:hypothetical protein
MLEELPGALEKELRQQVPSSDCAKQINSALEFVKESTHRMRLYKAHTLRVVIQQKALEGYRQELYEICAKEKNTEVRLLYIIIDFKMKWEAMYQREKTTDHFGKRGISWHGNRIEYFIWNKIEEKVEPGILKLAQILSGVNKQDMMTVLALLEAMQAFCSVLSISQEPRSHISRVTMHHTTRQSNWRLEYLC